MYIYISPCVAVAVAEKLSVFWRSMGDAHEDQKDLTALGTLAAVPRTEFMLIL
jgi:hypothetical protein